jgi:predicted nucleic acid-binding protein
VYSDADTTRRYGEIAAELRRAGRPIQQNDIWIAALCKQHGYILATRDTDFSTIIGLETIGF